MDKYEEFMAWLSNGDLIRAIHMSVEYPSIIPELEAMGKAPLLAAVY